MAEENNKKSIFRLIDDYTGPRGDWLSESKAKRAEKKQAEEEEKKERKVTIKEGALKKDKNGNYILSFTIIPKNLEGSEFKVIVKKNNKIIIDKTDKTKYVGKNSFLYEIELSEVTFTKEELEKKVSFEVEVTWDGASGSTSFFYEKPKDEENDYKGPWVEEKDGKYYWHFIFHIGFSKTYKSKEFTKNLEVTNGTSYSLNSNHIEDKSYIEDEFEQWQKDMQNIVRDATYIFENTKHSHAEFKNDEESNVKIEFVKKSIESLQLARRLSCANRNTKVIQIYIDNFEEIKKQYEQEYIAYYKKELFVRLEDSKGELRVKHMVNNYMKQQMINIIAYEIAFLFGVDPLKWNTSNQILKRLHREYNDAFSQASFNEFIGQQPQALLPAIFNNLMNEPGEFKKGFIEFAQSGNYIPSNKIQSPFWAERSGVDTESTKLLQPDYVETVPVKTRSLRPGQYKVMIDTVTTEMKNNWKKSTGKDYSCNLKM